MIRFLAVAAFLLVFTACTAADQARVANAVAVGCQIDATWQPLGAAVLAGVPQTTIAATVDTALIHPAVVAACAARGGTPAAVVTSAPAAPLPLPLPPAPPPVAKP